MPAAGTREQVEKRCNIQLWRMGIMKNNKMGIRKTMAMILALNMAMSCVAVTAEAPAENPETQVQQVQIDLNEGIEQISPKFGTVAVGKFRELFLKLEDLRQDVNELLGTEIE